MSVFEVCRQRIDRANFHNDAAATLWNSTIPDKAYSSVLKVNDDGTGQILVQTASDVLMNSIAIELGEALYQLRAALDACIYEAAIRYTRKNPPPNESALQFPVCINDTKFKEAARQIAPLPDELRRFIESVQPYNTFEHLEQLEILSVNRTLAILSHWARIDRHRRLHVIGVLPVAFSPKFTLPADMSIAYLNVATRCILKDESQIATFKIEGFRRGAYIEMNPNLSFDVVVDEAPLPSSSKDILGERMRAMFIWVPIIVETFEEFFRRENVI